MVSNTRPIDFVEAERVDAQQRQRLPGDLKVDAAFSTNLREVADAAQQAVRNARRASGTLCNLSCAALVNFDLHQSGGAPHD